MLTVHMLSQWKLTVDVVDAIAESSDVIVKEEVFDTLKGLLK
jgi:hypothetical protein